jgi:flavin reductase (DIM6/NTAB) family NADH-FMN oxidoreductase RutF
MRQAIRSVLLGRGSRTACDLPLQFPQTEVAVWLHGLGEPRDVTMRHAVACPIPFILCVGFEDDDLPPPSPQQRLALKWVERAGNQRLLGTIEIEQEEIVASAGPQVRLYRATRCTNFCTNRLRRFTRALYVKGERWMNPGRLLPSVLDARCNEVVFTCPRPVVLVSLMQNGGGNIFPMQLMGQVGREHFAFALNSSKQAAPIVAALGQVALSTVPFGRANEVRRLGANHHRSSIDWATLPFVTQPSPLLGIPVPDFALTVRELEVEQTMPLGSHTLFIARVLSRNVYSEAPEFHRIHGLYAAHRVTRYRGSAAE